LTFSFIRENQAEFPISIMCSVFDVSRSGYYVWLKQPEGKKVKKIKLY